MRTISLLIGASFVSMAHPAAAQSGGQAAAPAPVAAPAPTETLRDAMVRAYNTNPQILSERANQRANDENVPIARSQGLPSASGTGSISQSIYDSGGSAAIGGGAGGALGPTRTLNSGLDLSLPIYSGGSVRNSVRAAETRVRAGQASLRGAEATLFTQVVAAYLDVIRDEAIVRLNQENVRVLEVNLQATQDRFQVGDLTRTDVAQSEARLALARSQLQSAEAVLIGSREEYIRVIGTAPGVLASPPPLPNLPADVTAAVAVALEENPDLLAAQQDAKAAGIDVKVARAGRLPTVSLGASGSYYNYLGTLPNSPVFAGSNDGVSTSAGVQLQIPLFQGGRPAAQIRQAQARQSAALEQVTGTERSVIANTRSAYASWQSAQHVIESSQVAVKANRLSLEGVRAENSVGTRTILDILNAEQELLNSQVTLVTARRDAYVAGFALLAAMGRAEAQDLGLDGGPLYDPVTNYRRVRGKMWDWDDDPAPRPMGSRTADTPAQTPVVNGPLDPEL